MYVKCFIRMIAVYKVGYELNDENPEILSILMYSTIIGMVVLIHETLIVTLSCVYLYCKRIKFFAMYLF